MSTVVEHDRNGDRRHPSLRDRAFLVDQYIERGKSTRRIAADLGVSHEAVRRALRRAKIERRPRGRYA